MKTPEPYLTAVRPSGTQLSDSRPRPTRTSGRPSPARLVSRFCFHMFMLKLPGLEFQVYAYIYHIYIETCIVYMLTYIYIYICLNVHLLIHIYICVYIYICIHIYIYMHDVYHWLSEHGNLNSVSYLLLEPRFRQDAVHQPRCLGE